MKQACCKACGAVVVQRYGTDLVFKSDSDVRYFATTSTWAGRCKSCMKGYQFSWDDLMGPKLADNLLTNLLQLA